MGGGLAFLSKKFFNPANLNNQRRVWEAEQRAEKEAKAAKERAEQLKRERDDEELAKARGGKTGGDRAVLSFMYAVPPGMADEKKRGGNGDDDEDAFGLHVSESDDRKPAAAAAAAAAAGANASASGDITQRQPGDDDAAAAFRAMLAGHQRSAGDADHDASQTTGPSNALVGSEYDPSADQKPSASSGGGASGDNRTQLEKAVGRRDAYNTSLTLEEQVARFPSLKNAPMAPGMKADNVNVSFKPLGAEIRNVKCLKCGVWGHSKGDRECKLGGWNPFELGSALVPGTSMAPVQGAAYAAAPRDTQDRATDDTMRTLEGKEASSNRKRAYSSESSSSSSSDTDSSEEERRRRRRKKKERRKRSKKSSRSHRKSRLRDQDDYDDRGHSRKKRKHVRERERSQRRYDDDYSSDGSDSYNSHEDRKRRKRDSRKKSRRKSWSRSRSRSRSKSRS